MFSKKPKQETASAPKRKGAELMNQVRLVIFSTRQQQNSQVIRQVSRCQTVTPKQFSVTWLITELMAAVQFIAVEIVGGFPPFWKVCYLDAHRHRVPGTMEVEHDNKRFDVSK